METPIRRKISQRALTPYPKDSVGPEEMEQMNIAHFREAAEHFPAEYTSSTGDMYVIRRPYGIETAPRLFHAVNAMPMEQYRRRAHVSDLTTIEVAVEIKADRSLFLLHGVAGVQYFNNNGNNISAVALTAAVDGPSIGRPTNGARGHCHDDSSASTTSSTRLCQSS